jgi:UDP-N-acetylmuramate dehydrogenase
VAEFKENISLKDYSNYRIGGPAEYFFESRTVEETRAALEKWREIFNGDKSKLFILGGGTNILFRDQGFSGLVLKISINFISPSLSGEAEARIGAGTPMAEVVAFSEERGWSGLEWAAGLPGRVGGAIYGNAGAFGREIKDSVLEVESLDIFEPDKIIRRTDKDRCFNYRSSVFKENNREIILKARFKFEPSSLSSVAREIKKNINYRKERQPLEYPSAGSVFKNVDLKEVPEKYKKMFSAVIKTDPFPVLPAAFLISEAGLKGLRRGGAMLSTKHTNFIVNAGGATASDVLSLIDLIKKEVRRKFDIELEEEIRVI